MKYNHLTPMLQQYMEIKENTNDALVFYRLGDFYELFFEDAITASRVLDLVLTARSAGKDQKAPMCGVPHHAAQNYIQKLVLAGHKVAIVEQVENPKEVKGIVKREVVEIVTPGTYFDNEENDNREIAALHTDLVYATVVSCNIVNGAVRAMRVMNDFAEIVKVLQQFQVKEIVIDPNLDGPFGLEVKQKTDIYVSYQETVDNTVVHKDSAIQSALSRLSAYLQYTHKRTLDHLGKVQVYNDQSYLRMDYNTMTNLELIDHQKGKELSLYHFINKTRTNMGSREMKHVLMQPLVSVSNIKQRHHQIETLMDDFHMFDALVDNLKQTYDVHRIVARLATGKHNAQDFVRLKKTLKAFEAIQEIPELEHQFAFATTLNPLKDVSHALEIAFLEDAPVQLKEGRTFKAGIHAELDELIALSKDGKQWLLEFEAKQREQTGIKNLKVGYTRAFGYYIEISKGQVDNVKESFGFIRKQTLTNAERYISQDLQEYEVKTSQASNRILEIETELFDKYTRYIHDYGQAIHEIGQAIASLDVLVALSEVSSLPGYVKPKFVDGKVLNIHEGRHPVLETTLQDHQYISSDVNIAKSAHTLILTGPNMGGKSTFMRMTALNLVLAQIGCYVPCSAMELSIVDQIFTRMGASDDILLGQSTFMVEMIEAQTALSKATGQSLILFDEIGRGTSTYDGMALAQAIIEFINNSIQARTIFSTHYHELTHLESMYEGIQNVQVEVHEENDHVTFLYRVIKGKADKSYGINVARLAHLPQSIITRAQENLQRLELTKDSIDLGRKVIQVEVEPQGYSIVKRQLEALDINKLTPLEALVLIESLKKTMEESEDA